MLRQAPPRSSTLRGGLRQPRRRGTMHSAGALGATCGAAIGLSATLAAIFSRLGHQRAALAQPISREANRLRRRMPVSSRKIIAAESPQIILRWWATIKGQEMMYFKLPTSTSHLTEDPNAGSVHSPCRAACRLRSSIRLNPAP